MDQHLKIGYSQQKDFGMIQTYSKAAHCPQANLSEKIKIVSALYCFKTVRLRLPRSVGFAFKRAIWASN